MKINWKVRLQHKPFLIGLFSLILILAQQILALFDLGISEAFTEQAELLFNSVLSILVFIGVVTDPTTEGLEDSPQSLRYNKPKKGGY